MRIVAIVVLSMLCGAKGWEDMEEWADAREEWLAIFLDLRAGVPSADTLRRVLAALEPKAFGQGFSAWSQAIAEKVTELHVAVDGKTVCGSERLGLTAVHITVAVDGHVARRRRHLVCSRRACLDPGQPRPRLGRR